MSAPARVRALSVREYSITLGLCAAVAAADGFDAQAMAFAAPGAARELAIAPGLLGAVFASALVGLTLGALALSVLADRIGRRPVIVGSVIAFGAFSLATASADSPAELLVWRFLTGLGLGGALPNVNALAAEVSPPHRRAFLMTLMFSGFPLGGVLGGLVSVPLIGAFGWRAVFVLGGIVPLALTPLLWAKLRESPLIDPLTDRGRRAAGDRPGAGPRTLFTEGRAPLTLLLWVTCFASLLLMYALFNWLPSVLASAGVPVESAILASVIFNLGGILGGLALAAYLDRTGRAAIVAAAYLAAAVVLIAIGSVASSPATLMVLVFAAGATLIGTQLALNVVMANYYPTALRATGLGWALGMGRLGSILGPLIVGTVVAANWSLEGIFAALAAPAVAAAVAMAFFVRHQAGTNART